MRRRACVVAIAVAACLAAAAPASATDFKIQYLCNDRGTTYPVVGARAILFKRDPGVRYLWGGSVVRSVLTDDEGRASISVGGPESNFFFRLTLSNDQLELRNWYGSSGPGGLWMVDTGTNQNDVPVHDLGAQVLGDGQSPPECSIWEGLRQAHANWVATAPPERPPGWGRPWTVKLYAPTRFGAPFAHGDDIDWPMDHPTGNSPGIFTSVLREFGKLVLHGVQTAGDEGHLNDHMTQFGDYDAPDRPCRRTNIGHAFNAGWGEWWAGAYGPAPKCPNISANDYSVAGNVAATLRFLERFCPGGRRRMVEVFEWESQNRPHIHTLADFRRALDCQPGVTRLEDASPNFSGVSLGRLTSFAKRQLRELSTLERTQRTQVGDAVARARGAKCPPTPCTDTLERVTLPYVLRAELGQARLLRKTLSIGATRAGLRRLAGRSETQWIRSLNARARAFRLGATKVGELQMTRALAAAAPILRRDKSAGTQAAGRRLRALRKAFRARRLPAGFLLAAPAGAHLLPVSAPPPPPASPGPTGPKPDLVVDAVGGLQCGAGCEMYATVRNAGAANAPPSKTALAHVDRDTSQETETLVNTPALAPGQSVTVKADCGYAPASFSARADATSVVDEADENNNRRARENNPVAPECRYN